MKSWEGTVTCTLKTFGFGNIIASIIGFVTFIVYLPALQNGFVNWDDHRYVYENLNIQSVDTSSLIQAFFSFYFNNWHPLTMISYAVDYALWGLNPFGYHLTNIVFHSLNTFLVYMLVMRLMDYGSTQNLKLKTQNFCFIAAGVTALLFGIHPIHVESVAWISERKDVLYAFFYLLSLLSYVNYASAGSRNSSRSYVFSLVWLFLALLSKPMAVSLPLVLLILDCYPLNRLNTKGGLKNIRGALLEKVPFFLLSLLSSLVTVFAQHGDDSIVPNDYLPLDARFVMAIRGYVFYLQKMLFPAGLAPFYPYPGPSYVFNFESVVFAMLLLTITATVMILREKNGIFIAVWFYYLVTLIPVIGIVQVGAQAAADRYAYLPGLGPSILAGAGIGTIFERSNKKAYRLLMFAALLIIFAALGFKTISQITIWRDSITLWSHEIKIFPNTASIAYSNRGTAYYSAGNYERAMNDYNKAVEIEPENAEPYNNRGNVYNMLGEYEKAIIDYSRAVELEPGYADAYYNRGFIHHKSGRYDEAIDDYTRAIELYPDHLGAYNNRGILYNYAKDYKKAINDYNAALMLNRGFVEGYNNRGIVYNNTGNYIKAMDDFNTAISLKPEYADAYINRGITFRLSDRFGEAISDFKKGIELNPGDSMAYVKLGFLYLEIGDKERSREMLIKAARLGSGQAQDYLNGEGIEWFKSSGYPIISR